jgi:hypothetical protein
MAELKFTGSNHTMRRANRVQRPSFSSLSLSFAYFLVPTYLSNHISSNLNCTRDVKEGHNSFSIDLLHKPKFQSPLLFLHFLFQLPRDFSSQIYSFFRSTALINLHCYYCCLSPLRFRRSFWINFAYFPSKTCN